MRFVYWQDQVINEGFCVQSFGILNGRIRMSFKVRKKVRKNVDFCKGCYVFGIQGFLSYSIIYLGWFKIKKDFLL